MERGSFCRFSICGECLDLSANFARIPRKGTCTRLEPHSVRVSYPFLIMRNFARLVVATAVLVGASTNCGPSSGQFCTEFCASYGACRASVDASPLAFCAASSSAASACNSACGDSVERLGDSRGPFLDCATCVAENDATRACDKGKMVEVARVACTSKCESVQVGNATNAFYSHLEEALRDADKKASVDEVAATCSETGTKTWSVTREPIQHRGGEAVGAKWSYKGSGLPALCYGPYVTLPAGHYRAGFRNVGVSPSVAWPSLSLLLRRGQSGSQDSNVKTFTRPNGEIAIDFTLEKRTGDVEIVLDVMPGPSSAPDTVLNVSVGDLFITRL